jgi:flagellar protein FlaJ
MIFNKRYSLLAYSIFRGQLHYVLPYFQGLKQTLQKMGESVQLEEYAASFLLTLAIVAPAIALVTLFYLLSFTKADAIALLAGISIAALTTAGALFVGFLAYPQYKVNELKGAIDKHVAFAATHMATISGTGVPPHIIFHMLGQFAEYGEVAKACQRVARTVTVFGYDTISAISEEAQKTPSHKFKDLLWSVVATIRTGGDLREMLMAKSKNLMEEQRRTEAKYVETLSMMAEIYSTVFVAGIVMIFVLVAIMGILGGLPVPVKLVLEVTTYLGVPVASIAFIFVVESSKPSGV